MGGARPMPGANATAPIRSDPDAAINYARALRRNGQRAQAVAVLEQAAIQNPKHTGVLGAYGRALADNGHYKQALDVLNRAHTPDQPDWRILSVQGAVLDQMGRHEEAQRYYAHRAADRARRAVGPVQSRSVLCALQGPGAGGDRRCGGRPAQPRVDPRVRKNLALVVGLQGRFSEADGIARADLPSDEGTANVAYLRQMLAQQNGWKQSEDAGKPLVRAEGS